MFEPFLNHVSVSGGFPAHLQFRVTSESTSTVVGCGSTNRIGPTGAAETDRGGETKVRFSPVTPARWQKEVGLERDEQHVTHSEHPPGC